MSYPVLILGQSGSGKSTAIRTLPPKETFLFNICGKQLPFKGANNIYTEISEKNISGNKLTTDDYDLINKQLEFIDKKKNDTHYIVIDDSQYLLVNEFMRKHSTQGKGNEVFALYNAIGDHFWNLLFTSRLLRKDIFVFFLHHSELTETGNVKAKTIGRMLDEKVDIPGMFSFVLYACRDGQKNVFYTNNDGTHPSKTPHEMFDEIKIDNDLFLISNKIKQYYEEA